MSESAATTALGGMSEGSVGGGGKTKRRTREMEKAMMPCQKKTPDQVMAWSASKAPRETEEMKKPSSLLMEMMPKPVPRRCSSNQSLMTAVMELQPADEASMLRLHKINKRGMLVTWEKAMLLSPDTIRQPTNMLLPPSRSTPPPISTLPMAKTAEAVANR